MLFSVTTPLKLVASLLGTHLNQHEVMKKNILEEVKEESEYFAFIQTTSFERRQNKKRTTLNSQPQHIRSSQRL